MKIAIIGLPQAGKRTLFTLLTGRSVPEGRKPEETIEGIAWVRDPRIDALTDIFQPKKSAYAENNFVLCPDATTGGESYEWLNAARRCHLVCLVLRAFEDDGVYHPAGSVDADRARRNLEAELLLADMELGEKRLERLARESKSGLNPEQDREKAVLDKAMACLEDDRFLDQGLAGAKHGAGIPGVRLLATGGSEVRGGDVADAGLVGPGDHHRDVGGLGDAGEIVKAIGETVVA